MVLILLILLMLMVLILMLILWMLLMLMLLIILQLMMILVIDASQYNLLYSVVNWRHIVEMNMARVHSVNIGAAVPV